MPIDRRILVLLVAFGLLAFLWLTRDDAQAQVRHAHSELARLLSKTEDDTSSMALLSARALQNMFADATAVSGEAGGLAAVYSREDVARTVVGAHGLHQWIDLSFGELAIDFPAENVAIASFLAELVATSSDDGELLIEARQVTTQMSKIDGEWLFTRFELEAVTL